MTKTPYTFSCPTIGTTSQALVGSDVNFYLYNSRWVSPLRKYLDADHILRASAPLSTLPPNSIVIQGVRSGYTYNHGWCHRTPLLPFFEYALPQNYRIYVVGAREDRGNGWAISPRRLNATLALHTREEWEERTSTNNSLTYWGAFTNQKEAQPVFSPGAPECAVIPYLEVGKTTSPISLPDLQALQLGLKYFLKLLQLGAPIEYDNFTTQWLEKEFI